MGILHDGLCSIGIGNSFCGIATAPLEEVEAKMESYIALLQEFNAKFDLINTDGHDEIAIRHILDSLSAVPALCAELSSRGADFSGGFSAADIGSGAGLPGIPLAAVFPQIPFTLVERMTKRCAFLSHCAEELSLKNVTVEENQAERLSQGRFDFCAFRAFRPLEKKMMKVLLRILKDGGFLAAYKARRAKIDEEMNSLPVVPHYAVVPLSVPFLTENTSGDEERERNLVVITR